MPPPIPSVRPICQNPNCGYHGPMKKKARGSWVLLVVLFLLWILPGLIYLMFFSGYQYNCPRCGARQMV